MGQFILGAVVGGIVIMIFTSANCLNKENEAYMQGYADGQKAGLNNES